MRCTPNNPRRIPAMFATVMLLVAVILFALAAFNVPSSPVSLGWLGLAFFAGSFLSRLV
jgi:hypothetical protein